MGNENVDPDYLDGGPLMQRVRPREADSSRRDKSFFAKRRSDGFGVSVRIGLFFDYYSEEDYANAVNFIWTQSSCFFILKSSGYSG